VSIVMTYTQEAVSHVASRIVQTQEFLGQKILLENVSSYLSYKESTMTEWQFYDAVCQQADCYMLLDINNIYVSARNHQFDPKEYIDGIDKNRVRQIHLAGHTDYGDYVIDTHDQSVCDPVWTLYDYAIARLGAVSTMIERDDNIPPLGELVAELDLARAIAAKRLGTNAVTKEAANV